MSEDYEKLKIEHARYKKALESICNSVYLTDAHRGAKQALNPPIPLPPSIAELCAALRPGYRITFYPDESGYIANDTVSHSFYTSRDALDFLKGASPLLS